jgi:uncharacterized membrane protein YeaQ/YmgE (transglycosylase-associated protein family)
MSSVGVFQTAVIGILAGWLAEKAMKLHHSLFVNLIVGLAGAFVGAILFSKLNITGYGLAGMFVVSTVGAMLLLGMLGLLRWFR